MLLVSLQKVLDKFRIANTKQKNTTGVVVNDLNNLLYGKNR